MKKKIISGIILFAIIIGAALIFFLNKEDETLTYCKMNNIAEWAYARGDMFETCLLDEETLVFTDKEKSLDDLNKTYNDELNKISSLYLDNITKLSKKNIEKYYEACEKNTDDSLMEFCIFFTEFYEIYSNN